MEKKWQGIAGLCGLSAVALGAFGAHALKDQLVAQNTLEVWKTASQYHLIHAVVMLLPSAQRKGRLNPAFWFLFGILLFSGSLYLLALTGIRVLGMITPLGGVFFMVGWALLVFEGFRATKS